MCLPIMKFHTEDGDMQVKNITFLSVDIGTKLFNLLIAYKALISLALQ